MPNTVILGTARTPFGKMGGALKSRVMQPISAATLSRARSSAPTSRGTRSST